LAFHRADSFELILSNLQASYNKISDLQDLDDELAVLPKLETVYLEGNPCQLKDRTGYRRKVILALPRIQQVDAT
jgi:protein phosphatase 1 regulatory subunit 7